MFSKKLFIALVEATHDPLAPTKLNDAYAKLNSVGKMLANISNKDKAVAHTAALLGAYPRDMDHIASDPEFVVAVCNLAASALTAYVAKLMRE